MPGDLPQDKIRTTLYLSLELHKALRRRAGELDTSVSQLVSDYCAAGLAGTEGGPQ